MAFDLDGTLLDARPRQTAVAVAALAEYSSVRLDTKRFWRLKRAGAGTRSALEQLGFAPAVAGAAAQRWREQIEADEWLALDTPLSGVRRALNGVRRHGTEVLVLTARRRADGARRSLEHAALTGLIDRLVVVDPAQAAAAKAAELSRCRAWAFVGDTASDGQAAARAGIRFMAVTTGQRSRAHLTAAGYPSVATLSAALRLVGGSA